MKTRVFLTTSAVLALLSAPTKAGDLTFTTVNNTNENIVRLWISPHSNRDWDDADEADNVYIPHGGGHQTTNFDSPAYGSNCFEDLRVQFQDGQKWTVNNLNLCQVSVVTIDADRNHRVTYSTR